VSTSAADERVMIVDRDNQPTGAVPRWQMREQGLIYRATYILVLNAGGALFVQLRSRSKDMYPGYYDAAAGGVILAGESYDESARRELREELGIASAPLDRLLDFYYADSQNRIWGRAYRCLAEGPFRLQQEEIDDGIFCSIADVLAGRYQPLTPDSRYVLEHYYGQSATGCRPEN
jgi:8-oxo-dGTP pyrophosphatase MutT (NUDIX family)